jgi:hypothetical protein
MKILRFVTFFSLSVMFLQCASVAEDEQNSTASQVIEEQDVELPDYNLAWQEFVTVVMAGSKAEVMIYLDDSNEAIQNEVDLAYEYYFDQDFKDKLITTTYSELEDGEYGDKPAKVLAIHHSYEIDGTTLESSYIYYFGETSKGLVIYDILIAG